MEFIEKKNLPFFFKFIFLLCKADTRRMNTNSFRKEHREAAMKQPDGRVPIIGNNGSLFRDPCPLHARPVSVSCFISHMCVGMYA